MAITFNPKEIADNLKDHGSFIPGYRPGKRTADYLERVLMRITYVGAAFLAVIAIIPNVISSEMEIPLSGGQFLRRHRAADRHQRRPRPCAEDQQPPRHAELPRTDRRVMGVRLFPSRDAERRVGFLLLTTLAVTRLPAENTEVVKEPCARVACSKQGRAAHATRADRTSRKR